MRRAIRYCAYVVVTVVMGDLLARQVADLIYTGPGFVEALRHGLIWIGLLKLDSTYDLDGILLLAILVASLVTVGIAVWVFETVIRRHTVHR